MLINLIVMAMIAWLTISFLHIAIAQRGQAVRLYNNIQTDKAVLYTNDALISERLSLRLQLQSINIASSEQLKRLSSNGRAFTSLFDEMLQVINLETAKNEFFTNAATSRRATADLVRSLVTQQAQLEDYRKQVILQLAVPIEQRNMAIMAEIFDTQSEMLDSLSHLFRGLKYLPDSDASMVSKFHSILNEIIVVRSNVALKNTMMSELLISKEPPGTDLLGQINVLNGAIERQLDDIVMVAGSGKGYAELYQLALELRDYYNVVRNQSESDVKKLWKLPDRGGLTVDDWSLVAKNLDANLAELTHSTHEALFNLALANKRRATRNVIIDVLLVGMCLFIAFTFVGLSGRIKRMAFHDSLTGLPNRINFETALLANDDAALNGQYQHAVIFIDLDRFKSINDTYGHGVGDRLLKEVAKRLLKVCMRGALVARLGGDEFGVFLKNVESLEQVEKLAEDLVRSIVEVVKIDDLYLKVGASAGVSISPHDCECGTELLRNADIAMYHSKSNNIASVYRFDQSIAENYHKRLLLELDLRRGLEINELSVFYQPKVCTDTGRVKGVEALLRWRHPDRGFVSPAEFIPIAEEAGLMGNIGSWVMNEACRELAQLEKDYNLGIHLAVNISAQQFNDERFAESVYASISRHGLTNEKLELEVTESLVMHDVSRVIAMLKGLQQSGIRIAIDDFGTGYSSLQYLQELPLNTLKIDRAFVVALDENDPDCSVANSIVQLAKLFDLETVAEGVETDYQDARIRALGVNQIQGYRYSKPVPASLLPGVISQINARADDSGHASSMAA